MDLQQLIEKLTPDMYASIKAAVELGRWPDGRSLTEDQKILSLRAIIAFEIEHGFPEEERTGYLPPKEKKEKSTAHEETPLKWDP